jgi:broad specificity phosphatase PhoE
MRVLMVRHGQSENNLMASTITGDDGTDSLGDSDAFMQKWLSMRKDDPALTEKGVTEAELGLGRILVLSLCTIDCSSTS